MSNKLRLLSIRIWAFFISEINDKIKVMKEVYLYKKLTDKKIQCQNCAYYCVISPYEIYIKRTI